MRKKRFIAFLLSLAMAGTSVYTCGVIDVRAAAIGNEEAENPNLEQLAEEIEAQAAAMTDDELANPNSEQVEEEPEAQATAGKLELSGVSNNEAEWGNEVKIVNSGVSNPKYWCQDDGETISTLSTCTVSVGHIGDIIAVSADGYMPVEFKVEKRTISVGMLTVSPGEYQYIADKQEPSYTISDNAVGVELKLGEYKGEWANNTEPGEVRLEAWATSRCKTHRGTLISENAFEITKRKINSVNMEVSPKYIPYSGYGLEPTTVKVVALSDNQQIPMEPERDYTIEWTKNISVNDIPEAKIMLSSNGYFEHLEGDTGSLSKIAGAFEITPRETSFTAKFKGKESAPFKFNYGTTVSNISSDLVVSDGNLSVSTDDYRVEWEKTLSADTILDMGSYSLTITGSGNYAPSSTATCEFQIVPEGVSDGDISVQFVSENKGHYEDYEVSFNGQEQKPEVAVSVNAKGAGGSDAKKEWVSLNSDEYDVTYEDHKNAGTAYAKVTLKPGKYTETDVEKKVSFNILPIDISANGDKLVSCNVKKNPVYNGGAQGPEADDIVLSANLGGEPYFLISNVDYTVSEGSYSQNIEATVNEKVLSGCRVEGSGNFTGSKKISYRIEPKDISSNDITNTLKDTYSYTGNQISPNFVMTDTGSVSTNKNLVKDKDYTVEYGANNSMKTPGTVTVKGKGNYKGEFIHEFTISDGVLTDVYVESVNYTGQPISEGDLYQYVRVSSDDFAVSSDDYYVKYAGNEEANTDAGVYPIKIEGTNKYSGSVLSGDFVISPADFTSANTNLKVNVGSGYKYKSDDSEIWDRPEVEVSFNEIVLSADQDYEAEFVRKAGAETGNETGELTLKPLTNNFKGNYTCTFNIFRSDFGKVGIEVSTYNNEFVYTGKAIRPEESDIVLTDTKHNVVLSSDDFYISSYTNNINAGTATMQVIAASDSEYTGACDVKFTIKQKDISANDVMLSGNENMVSVSAPYTGDDVELSANEYNLSTNCLSYNGKFLSTSTNDYQIIFKKDDKERVSYYEVGDYLIIAKGKGNYTGERKLGTFTVTPGELSANKFSLDPPESVFTGEPFKPDVVVERHAYFEGEDFTVTYLDDMINVGPHEVVIKGIGNYTGEFTLSCNVTRATINKDNTEVVFSGVSDNGQVLIDVRTDGRRLSENVDYTYRSESVSGASPKKWDVTVTGTGNYQGGLTTEVEFKEILLETEDVQILSDFTYTGEPQELTGDQIAVVKGGKKLSENRDYTVSDSKAAVNAGEYATLSINGIGDYTGAVTASAEIRPLALSEGSVEEVKDVMYAETPQAPEVKVTMLGRTLVKGSDYVVEVSDNSIEIGPHQATVKGIGNYGGAVSVSYNVVAPTLDIATIVEKKLPYTGGVQKPDSITVMLGDQVVPSNQYEISYANPDSVSVGSYGITVTGKDKYTGTATGWYQIVAAGLEAAEVSVDPVVYTGAKAEPQVTVTVSGITLEEGIDYFVDAGDAVDAKKNNALKVIGTGNYEGTIEAAFDINPAAITKSNVKVTIPSVTYDGTAKTPKNATVIVGDRALTAADYTLAVAKNADNKSAGKVNVTITGKGNYTGTVTDKWFTINAKDISKGKVSGIKDKTYTGKIIKQANQDVKVTVDGKTLNTAKDLTVTYKNNKNIGVASMTITGKGNYRGTITGRTFKIFPKKATIKKVTGGSKRFTVQVKKLGGGVSYQIQYRVKGSKSGYTRIEVKNPKAVIKGLRKGKTYTVKVRAFKKVGKKNYYGAFSKAKNVKVK